MVTAAHQPSQPPCTPHTPGPSQVRLMAAEAALSGGEVGVATHLCLQLAAVRFRPAWRLAAELACPQR